MKHKILKIGVLALVIAIAIPIYIYYKDNRASNFKTSASIYIYPDTSADEAIEIIASATDVRSIRSLKRTFRKKQVDQFIKAGHYTIDKTASSVYVARMLNNAWQSPVKLVVIETLRKKCDIASKLSAQLLIDSASIHQALDNKELLATYGFTPKNVFSMFMPATYEIYWTASIEDILDQQKRNYNAFWTPERDSLALKYGLNREKVAILASIVFSETKYIPEMPKIAGVYLNRLKIGMPLQADPTVAYIYNYELNRVLKSHLKIDSPYNTYKYAGLPPGPICVPTRESLLAVLDPDFGGSYGKGNIFFCANSDFSGSHLFAKTYSAHLVNAKAFQRALSKRLSEKK